LLGCLDWLVHRTPAFANSAAKFCHTPFLSGGDARGGGKRRRDARFCSDECRWKFHAQAARSERQAKKSKKSGDNVSP
jgi:hypothetical protein